MKEIDIKELLAAGNLYVGQWENQQAATGITVILAPEGMAAGLDVRGGGPASRDTRVLDPLAAAEQIHAIVLAGGSAFGLDAAGGVMEYLRARNIGLDVGINDIKVPLVCQSDIFDLGFGASDVYPTADMAYAACEAAYGREGCVSCGNCDVTDAAATHGNYQDGAFGAGCGATVGKILGPAGMQRAGIGSAAVQVGALMVGAIVVVNALGDVINPATGQIIAGAHNAEGAFVDTAKVMAALYESSMPGEGGAENVVANTTIGVIFTNAALNKAQLCKVAGMGHDGMARTIKPVHTSMDGDSLYAVSVGNIPATPDIVGTLAADVVSRAILKAVQ